MNTFHYIALRRYIMMPLSIGLSAITLMACNAESASAPTPLNSDEANHSTPDQGNTEPSVTADLTNDALIPPAEPVLNIAARPGKLVLSWSEQVDTQVVSIYRYDISKGFEQKLDTDIDPASTSVELPSQTHRSAWHRTQYRVELCSNTDCVSSQRVAIVGLAEQTITRVSPNVFIKDERYAQAIASNDDASVFVVSRPLEGAIDIHIHTGDQWVLTQHLRLSDLLLSSTRQFHMTLSASGDVIAILISDSSARTGSQIRILERLGEAWIETRQLSTTLPENAPPPSDAITTTFNTAASADNKTLQLSANGDRLLIQLNNAVSLFTRDSTGWESLNSTVSQDLASENSANLLTVGLSDYFQADKALLAISGSASLQKIFTLHENEQQLWLVRWQENTEDALATNWLPGTPLPVNGLDVSHDTQLKSNEQGSNIVIAGWESSATALRTPVMWRFQINTTDFDTPGPDESATGSISVIDSLRLAPTPHADASLRFTSDNTLSHVAVGWQLAQSSEGGTLEDAQLVTYSYHVPTRQWLTALELPEAIPTLAKRSFAGKVVMSAHGNTLFLGTAGFASGSNTNSAELLVLH